MLFQHHLLCSPRYKTVYNPHVVVRLQVTVICSSKTARGGRMFLAVDCKVFYIEENREDDAEKAPPICSTYHGNQYVNHLVYCDIRIL